MSTQKAIEYLQKVVDLFSRKELPGYVESAFLESDGSKPSSKWSMGNKVLMYHSNTTDARGIRQWRDVKRTLKKGCHATYILAPIMRKITKKDDDGNETDRQTMIGYRCMPVFRYEDTEPSQGIRPEDAAINTVIRPKDLPPLSDVAEKWDVTIRYDETAIGEGGSFNSESSEIRLCNDSDSTFWHELAHKAHSRIEKLKPGQDPEQEAVAQLSACVLARVYGQDVDNYTYHYIKTYADGNKPEDVGKLCYRVLKKTESVLKMILDAHQKPLIKAKVK